MRSGHKGLLLLIPVAVIGFLLGSPRQPATGPATAAPIAAGGSRLAQLLGGGDRKGYAVAMQPRPFSFPADHGPHPEFRNEWWYFTGNLDGQGGRRFGFELTLFRFAMAPGSEVRGGSRWQTRQVYIGHFAVTDAANEQFHVAQRHARGSMGLAGARAAPFRVWVEDWSVAAEPQAGGEAPDSMAVWRLHAGDTELSLDLALTQQKRPVAHGIGGLSQKSAAPGNASYYYSISRLRAAGELQIGSQRFRVSGLAWLDREWGSNGLSAAQTGWDWFALQLDDGTELMYYRLRRNDDSRDRHSAGTWIGASGDNVHLGSDQVQIEALDYWDNAQGDRYPMGWRLTVPRLGLRVEVTPVMVAQELRTLVRYWEGAVDVVAVRNGKTVAGRGYVELTGYAGAPRSE